MERVDSWLNAFIVRHVARIPRENWPAVNSDYWRGFKAAMVRHGVTEAVAEAASLAMMESPPEYLNGHLPAFLAFCRAEWAAGRAVLEAPTDREAAERLSRDCPNCGRNGWAIRESVILKSGRVLLPGSLYCICPLGRFFERDHRERAPDVRRRGLDLRDYPELWLEPED
jgi:hypothetical protein